MNYWLVRKDSAPWGYSRENFGALEVPHSARAFSSVGSDMEHWEPTGLKWNELCTKCTSILALGRLYCGIIPIMRLEYLPPRRFSGPPRLITVKLL
jgi:hypothetical protein